MFSPTPRWPLILASALFAHAPFVFAQDTQPSVLSEAVGHPNFLSPHARPIAILDGRVFVANTPADSLDVIDAISGQVIARVPLGIDPVGLALRPDGLELWVSNHVSDSVSVVDIDTLSPTYLTVIATIQDIDPRTRKTRFDEPVGLAFASNEKAYVALSSENKVAVVDVARRAVIDTLDIQGQDPRAIAVHEDRLYVLPFESGNKTQVSGCFTDLETEQCTFNLTEHVILNNNVLSLGANVDVVKHRRSHDRDLYVFDTERDTLVETIDTLGTLLYGLTTSSDGRVYIAQTDARNDVNGRASQGMGLAELENRAFLNQITQVDCEGSCDSPSFFDLEPLPPEHPAPGMALATPYAIEISPDDTTLVATAAGSNILFTVDADSGAVLGRVEVGAIPRGIALELGENKALSRAWVLNVGDNSVSLVDVSDPANPTFLGDIPLEDPTHPQVKLGRIAFNDANASTTGTFSCESCHPDGHTDQLLWVLDTPPCGVGDNPSYANPDAQTHGESLEVGCTQVPPRSTMPVRGLRDTAPYHWDGIPGDPYGGRNTESIYTNVAPNCDESDPASCTLNLVEGALASTMCQVGACPQNEAGKAGALSQEEREAMATFLLSIPYPPAQRRPYDNTVSPEAMEGFERFHVLGRETFDGGADVCGNCHRFPFWTSTNTGKTGMDAPTWRGAYDRWVILPQGRMNVIDITGPLNLARRGFPEELVWQTSWYFQKSFNVVFDMVREGSTGVSGAFGRQVTLNADSAQDRALRDLLDALEAADSQGGVALLGEGTLMEGGSPEALYLDYDDGVYRREGGGAASLTRDELETLALRGNFLGTFTGRAGPDVDVDHPQPALWTLSPFQKQTGRQVFPIASASSTTLTLSGRHLTQSVSVWVDGQRVPATVACQSGELPHCEGEVIEVDLESVSGVGMHLLQLQNQGGLFSNDFIFYVE